MNKKLIKGALVLSVVGSTFVSAFADDMMTTSMKTEFNSNLSVGSRGDDVSSLQKILALTPTGFFGRLTRGALIKYQRENGILATGYFGPKTRLHFKKPWQYGNGS